MFFSPSTLKSLKWEYIFLSWSVASRATPADRPPPPSPSLGFSSSFKFFKSFCFSAVMLAQTVGDQPFLSNDSGHPTLTCWWQPKIQLPTPAQSQHRLCRAVSGALVCDETQRGKKQSREAGMLFCAFCCSHSLLQSGGSLASIITAISLSLSFSPFLSPHTSNLSYSVTCSVPHAHFLCTVVFLRLPLVHPFPPVDSSPSEYWYLECVAAACCWN